LVVRRAKIVAAQLDIYRPSPWPSGETAAAVEITKSVADALIPAGPPIVLGGNGRRDRSARSEVEKS
jgi:hypothetical protein